MLKATAFALMLAAGLAGQAMAAEPPRVDWQTDLEHFQFDADKFIGQRFSAECPAATVKTGYDGVQGTDVYTSKSPICPAALHAGVIGKEGGIVTVQLNPGEDSYQGSERHGVQSADLPGTQRSMVFVAEELAARHHEIHKAYAPVLEWDSRFTRTGFAHKQFIGQNFTFVCPEAPGNLRWRRVVGTDVYEFKAIICQAAVHAGAIDTGGGAVTIVMDEGQQKLIGSIRNGVETKDGSSGIRSIQFVKPSMVY